MASIQGLVRASVLPVTAYAFVASSGNPLRKLAELLELVLTLRADEH